MALVTAWIVAAFVLFGAFAVCCGLALRRSEAEALAAAQGAGTIFVLLMVVLGMWWNDSALVSVALAGAVLALPSSLVMARLIARKPDPRWSSR